MEAVGCGVPADRLNADAGQGDFFEADQPGERIAAHTPAFNQRAVPANDDRLPGLDGDLGSLDRSHVLSDLPPFRLFGWPPGDRLALHPSCTSRTAAPQLVADGTPGANQMSLEAV